MASDALSIAQSIVNDAKRLSNSVEHSPLLPLSAYHSERFWEFEKEYIFKHEWLCIGHTSQVPASGDVLTRTLIDEPLLMLRNEQNQVQVFSAVCRHRGHPLLDGLDASPNQQCLTLSRLRCPYHGWTYDLDGILVSAPFMHRSADINELRANVRLPIIRTEIFHGFVFVNFDESAAPLSNTLDKTDNALENFQLSKIRAMSVISRIDLGFNWKGYFENSLEPYHTDFVHSSSHDAAPAVGSLFFDHDDDDGEVLTSTRFAEGSTELFSDNESETLPVFDGLTDEQQSQLSFIAIPPTWFAVVSPNSILVELVRPTGASKTDIESIMFYSEEARNLPYFDACHSINLENLQKIQREDQTTQSAVQRATLTQFPPSGPLSWLETTLPQFNAWLIRRYRKGLELNEKVIEVRSRFLGLTNHQK